MGNHCMATSPERNEKLIPFFFACSLFPLHRYVALHEQQISQELQASQVYLSLSAWAGHVNQALPGLEKFFKESAEEEREHAQKLINYQNRRGGKVILQTLQAPEADWSSARNAIESTLQLEKGKLVSYFFN